MDLFQVVADEDKFVFEEAMKFIEDKVSITSKEYQMLSNQCKNLAFTVSGYTELQILEEFKVELLKAIENGTTMEQFKSNMNTFLEEKGYKGMLPYKADIIFRTNMLTAFSVGHYESMTDKTVIKARPYWMYQTAGDGHVREEHQAMDGKVFEATDSIWNTWYPPNGYKCRCTVVSLSPEDVKRKGLDIENDYPRILDMDTGELKPIMPDKGFETNPAKKDFKPDLKGYSKEFVEAYQNREKNNAQI